MMLHIEIDSRTGFRVYHLERPKRPARNFDTDEKAVESAYAILLREGAQEASIEALITAVEARASDY